MHYPLYKIKGGLYMKTRKIIISLAMVASLVVGLVVGVMAAPKESKATTPEETTVVVAKAKISKAACTALGKINVTFKGAVEYAPEVTVEIKSMDGKEIKASISKKTKSMVVVRAAGMVKGEKYVVTIHGVKLKGAEAFDKVSRTFTAKRLKTTIKTKNITEKVSVKAKNTIVVKLKGKASYNQPEVKVVDENNKEYEAKIVKKTKGNIKVSILNLKKATKYTISITGVKTKKEKNYATITATFTTKK